jgi:hypothetical protein
MRLISEHPIDMDASIVANDTNWHHKKCAREVIPRHRPCTLTLGKRPVRERCRNALQTHINHLRRQA